MYWRSVYGSRITSKEMSLHLPETVRKSFLWNYMFLNFKTDLFKNLSFQQNSLEKRGMKLGFSDAAGQDPVTLQKK